MSVPRVESRSEPLDTVVRIVTPERIILQYPLAGPSRRFVAYLIDQILLVVLILLALLALLVLALGSMAGWGPALVAYFLLTWGYGAFCEGVFNGQTLGKYLLGIRVVSERGVAISGAQAILRNLVGSADGLLPFCFQIGLASMVLTRKFQRLGDLAAGTMVVIEERRHNRPITRIAEPEVEELLPWLPQQITASSELARALSDYVQERLRYAPPRRAEMAEPLAGPLRKRFGLSERIAADVVLCAVYHRIFLDDELLVIGPVSSPALGVSGFEGQVERAGAR
jgi:uncharacterized RDD family membrane protein YckC